MCKKTISSFEFFEMFPDERSAREYLEKEMWNGKPVCPYCESERITTLKKRWRLQVQRMQDGFYCKGGNGYAQVKNTFEKMDICHVSCMYCP